MNEKQHWYVVYTLPRWEKKVATLLASKGIEHYCPLNRVQKQWSDRKKVVLEPLFKGYVFIKTDEGSKWDLKKIDGIINYVYWLGKPAVVREEEIQTIKKFLEEFSCVQVVDSQLIEKDTVYINRGIFMDFKGIILEVFGSKARVQLQGLGLSLVAIFDKSNLRSADLKTV
jgi:transcription antitermination factor NusG